MIKSMTAYAQEVLYIENSIHCEVEIRSYNSKNLDIALYLPRAFIRYEDRIKKLTAQKFLRGRIEIRVGIEDRSDSAIQFEVDIARAKAYYAALFELRNIADSEITIQQIIDGKDMIKIVEKGRDDDLLIWETISKTVVSALDNLDVMRKKEGYNLSKDLLDRLNYIEIGLSKIEQEAALMPAVYRDRLMDRVASLIGTGENRLNKDSVDCNKNIENIEPLIDPVRIAQEIAFLADKSDISEEIVRLRSHIKLFREIIDSFEEGGGRKLNFLIQEFNREFNTIGSKSGKAELSHIVVDLKSELEKIREQIQNIE